MRKLINLMNIIGFKPSKFYSHGTLTKHVFETSKSLFSIIIYDLNSVWDFKVINKLTKEYYFRSKPSNIQDIINLIKNDAELKIILRKHKIKNLIK